MNHMICIFVLFVFISFIRFRIGIDNECWYFLLLSTLLCKLLFFTLLSFSGLLHLGVWNNPGSKGTINSSFFVLAWFSALTILGPEMLICKAHLFRVFHLNYLYRHLNRTSLLFVMQVISAIFQALMEQCVLCTLALILKTILGIPLFNFMDEETDQE